MPALLSLLLAVNIAPGAGLEYRNPQLAADRQIVAVTFGAGTSIYFSSSRDQGRTFSTPLKVAEVPLLALSHHRGPRIAITPSAVVISAVAGTKSPSGSDGDLRTWLSTDSGKSWTEGGRINDAAASAREGLHTMTAGPGGLLFAAWLDLRGKGTRLYSAVSKDSGLTWSKNALVYESASGTICQCCHPTALIDAQGAIHVMWRNALEGARNMYVADSTDGGATFHGAAKLGTGNWMLEACPMDGGGLAIDPRGALVSVWRRESDVYLASRGGPERKIEAGKDAAIAAGPDGVYTIWVSGPAIRALGPRMAEPVTVAAQGEAPQLIAVPGGPILAAWDSQGRIFIQPVVQ